MAAGQSPAVAGPTAVRETILRDGGSRNFGEIGRGETAVPVEVGLERDQPDQPGRVGEKGAYPSEVEARNLASRDSIGRERGKGGRWGKHGRGGRGMNEVGGGSVAAAGGDGNSAKAAEGCAPVRGCYRCDNKGHRIANCTDKQCSRCNGQGHTTDACPTSKEEAVLAVTGEVGARNDDGEDGTVQASCYKAEETGEFGDDFDRMGNVELAWQPGDEAWLCDSGASNHMTPSADHMINCKEGNLKLRIADGTSRSTEGYGDINNVFRSGNSLVNVLLTNVAHVPDLRHHLFSLPTLDKYCHAFEGTPHGGHC